MGKIHPLDLELFTGPRVVPVVEYRFDLAQGFRKRRKRLELLELGRSFALYFA